MFCVKRVTSYDKKTTLTDTMLYKGSVSYAYSKFCRMFIQSEFSLYSLKVNSNFTPDAFMES